MDGRKQSGSSHAVCLVAFQSVHRDAPVCEWCHDVRPDGPHMHAPPGVALGWTSARSSFRWARCAPLWMKWEEVLVNKRMETPPSASNGAILRMGRPGSSYSAVWSHNIHPKVNKASKGALHDAPARRRGGQVSPERTKEGGERIAPCIKSRHAWRCLHTEPIPRFSITHSNLF